MPVGSRKEEAPEATTTKARGDAAEAQALAYLQAQGLTLVQRNWRTPGRGGGEIDLIMRDGATLVFIEVRRRTGRAFGGAAASVTAAKRRRIVFAAQHYLLRLAQAPACRFDVVSLEGGAIQWLRAAFDAG
jgi:putative endonuclease